MLTSLKPLQALTSVSLALTGILCIGYSLIQVPTPIGTPFADFQNGVPVTRQMMISTRLPYALPVQVAGAVLVLGAVVNHDRHKLSSQDYDQAIDLLLSGSVSLGQVITKEAWDQIQSIGKSKTAKQIRVIAIRAFPSPIRSRFEQMEAAQQSQIVFEKFLKAPHNRLAGKTKAGKTFLLLKLLIDWLEANPNGVITICDINYGKPDRDTGEPFYWNGFPVECIRSNPAEILEASRAEVAELRQRVTDCREKGVRLQDLQPRLFIVTELDSTQEDVDEVSPKPGEFISNVRQVAKQGNGYKLKLIFDGQSLATGESGISQATADQLCVALLGTSTTNATEVSKFHASNAVELRNTCNTILKAGKRPAIIQLNEGDPVAVIVPDLGYIRQVRFAAVREQPQDPIETWWQQTFTPELQLWLQEQAEGYVSGEIKTKRGSGGPLKEWILPKFGVTMTDPRRIKVSDAWKQAQQQAEQKLKGGKS